MTLFLLGALLLGLLVSRMSCCGGAVRAAPADLDDPNLSWYRQRRAVSSPAATIALLLDDVRLRLLEEGAAPWAMRAP
jgi:hypothetical protein